MTTQNILAPVSKPTHQRPISLLRYLNASVLKRSLVMATFIGAALTLLTQSDALFGVSAFEELSLFLAFVTPFLVVTISQIVATHQLTLDSMTGEVPDSDTGFLKTLVSHNIPLRALVISLIVGSANSLIILAISISKSGEIFHIPWSLIAQVYLLPLFFGLVSQTLTYRRLATSIEHSPQYQSQSFEQNPNHLLPTKTVKLIKEGTIVRYAELGSSTKPPVLLLHGVPENLQAWYAVAPPLAKNYHVFALDWPGFGGSEPLASLKDYNSQHFANVVVDFMDSLGIQQASLIATDIALLPSLLVGLEHPQRASKLAVMDGIPFPRPQFSSWELKSFAHKGSILGKALVNWFPAISSQIAYLKGFYRGHSIPAEIRKEFSVDGKSKSNQQAFLSYFQNFHKGQQYFEGRVHQLKTPVLVLWGKYDRFISSKLGHEIAEKLPNARLEIIDKAGHYVHMDRPHQVTQLVSRFLEV